MFGWSRFMKERWTRKNAYAVVPGRIGGLVRGAAKQRANRENGCKGGQVKNYKKNLATLRDARRPRSARRKKS
jgi:hypothetical protein